jgi:hypothetical protein
MKFKILLFSPISNVKFSLATKPCCHLFLLSANDWNKNICTEFLSYLHNLTKKPLHIEDLRDFQYSYIIITNHHCSESIYYYECFS